MRYSSICKHIRDSIREKVINQINRKNILALPNRNSHLIMTSSSLATRLEKSPSKVIAKVSSHQRKESSPLDRQIINLEKEERKCQSQI